ncbi:hypothetical protein SPSIL_010320 [Sporomusa silvacetica DSM 10669]|uniref:HTH LytTR-type domain-containing protein n=1 Tax=Sporomusa silvacetica DSM 10669 TaxID=1123289 RepID=A0ABZ3IHR4_9FIRM|nr:LytTR family DNA-binding domain-containing protein [Sporomusa silvacetica]OZC21454.1 transcriptional regulatory protein YpdB [Sporomusa silvacetica DSM 10669]
MIKVVLVDNESYSFEKFASELGFHVEVAGNFSNLYDAMKKMKTTNILYMAHEKNALKPVEMEAINKDVKHKQISLKRSERVLLCKDDKIVLVDIKKIACCFVQKGDRKVTVAVENETYISNYTLNAFLNNVGINKLVRCHRSFAINPDYLSEIIPGANNTMVARVNGYNNEIPISRQYSPMFKKIVGLRMRTDCKHYS